MSFPELQLFVSVDGKATEVDTTAIVMEISMLGVSFDLTVDRSFRFVSLIANRRAPVFGQLTDVDAA